MSIFSLTQDQYGDELTEEGGFHVTTLTKSRRDDSGFNPFEADLEYDGDAVASDWEREQRINGLAALVATPSFVLERAICDKADTVLSSYRIGYPTARKTALTVAHVLEEMPQLVDGRRFRSWVMTQMEAAVKVDRAKTLDQARWLVKKLDQRAAEGDSFGTQLRGRLAAFQSEHKATPVIVAKTPAFKPAKPAQAKTHQANRRGPRRARKAS